MVHSKINSLSLGAALFILSVPTVFAAGNPIEFRFLGVSVQERAERAIEFLLSIVGSLALLMLIIGGVYSMLATGNSNAQTKAKKMVIGSLAGLILVLLSYSFIYFTNDLLVN